MRNSSLKGQPKFRSNKERLSAFLRLFKKQDQVLILIVADPDSLASALAVKKLLQGKVQKITISHVNEIKRLNNQVMVSSLKIPLNPFKPSLLTQHNKFILVDSQPTHQEVFKNVKFTAVIDHHPLTSGWSADYVDIRPDYGATATILYEYLKTAKVRPGIRLATAMVYAIKTDTNNFEKSAKTQDVLAFQYFYRYMNRHLLHKIECSDLRRSELKYFKIALENLKYVQKRAFTFVGKVLNADILVVIADFLNKVFETSWVFVAGECKKKLVVIVRCDGYRKDAGKLVSRAFKHLGSAGGHKEKARAEIPFENLGIPPEEFTTHTLINLLKKHFRRLPKREAPLI